jgi:hypothetical protein
LIYNLNDEVQPARWKARKVVDRETVNQTDRTTSQSPEGGKRFGMVDKYEEGHVS